MPLPAGYLPASINLQSATLEWLPLRSCRGRAPPFQAGSGCSRPPLCKGPWPQQAAPLQVAMPWPVAPVGSLAMANHLCMQTACRWPPLTHRQHLLSLPIAATNAHNSSTHYSLITRSLKSIFRMKT
ncbi:hypothetical protein BHE74_00015495 [Ensete ventricosum]|nr:hypothetical protein GW17_00037867 [Ensete ventricosum]RWW76449.1 hypothetical protein BHE74_00015495 [Ensete ventricosum]